MSRPGSPAGGLKWSSRFTFALCAVGGAVGLGSIWRFPFLVGTGGGSAFLFVFVVAIVFVALPLLVAEFLLGRRGGGHSAEAVGVVARESGRSPRWNAIGQLGTLAAFLILSYYTVVASWMLAYMVKCGRGQLNGQPPEGVATIWREFLASPGELVLWHLAFVALVVFISARGIHRGIELANRIRAPALLGLLLVLVGYSLATGDTARGLAFAFAPNWQAVTPPVVLAAIGQAFYATGVGMAMMIAFGTYVEREMSLVRSAVAITASILVVSLLATLLVFPLAFRFGFDPAQGPTLIFDVLATVFAAMPAGRFFGTLFFLLLVFSALTPSLAGLEPVVGWLVGRGASRQKAALLAGLGTWALGLASVASFNLGAEFFPLGFLPLFAQKTVFDVLDYLTSNLMLPVGALATSLLVGWRLRPEVLSEELATTHPLARKLCIFALRWVCPVAILAVLVANGL